jgi:DNA-binding MarR family transcriptional regulator
MREVRTRGRPKGQLNPTRRRVLSYLRDHGPCSIGQVVRATGVERSRLKRIMRALTEIAPEPKLFSSREL